MKNIDDILKGRTGMGAKAVVVEVTRLLSRHAELALPFVTAAFCDGILLALLFWAARPVEALIVAQGGAQVSFTTVPDIFVWAREIVGIITGLFLLSVGIVVAFRTRMGHFSDWRFAARKAVSHYFSVAAAWLLVRGATAVVLRLIWVGAGVQTGRPGIMAVNAALAVLLQMPFMYVLPVILIENRRLVPALRRSVNLMGRYPAVTAFVTLIAALILLPTAAIYQGMIKYVIWEGASTGYFISIAHICSVWCSMLWLSVAGAVLLYRHKQNEKDHLLPLTALQPVTAIASEEDR